MKKKLRLLLLIFLLLFPSMLFSEVFPLAHLLDLLEFSASDLLYHIWQPDWPFDIAPDAFRVNNGEVKSIRIEGAFFGSEAGPDEGAEQGTEEGAEIILKLNTRGQPEVFPFIINGELSRVTIFYSEEEPFLIEEMHIAASSSTWEISFLEYERAVPYERAHPYLVRVFHEGFWYFVNFGRGVSGILETWYDEDGNPLIVFGYSLINISGTFRIRYIYEYFSGLLERQHHYNSYNLVSFLFSPFGIYDILYYREGLPRYWDRQPFDPDDEWRGIYSFQWDGEDRLVRIHGGNVDHRYEYNFDERGNWIERRETRMTFMNGLLFPQSGNVLRRIIEYEGD